MAFYVFENKVGFFRIPPSYYIYKLAKRKITPKKIPIKIQLREIYPHKVHCSDFL